LNVHTHDTTGTPVFRVLRESICTLDKPFGTVLREIELAEEFGVSRTPIRQALHQHAAIGLVETRNGVGTIVTAGDPETLEDIYSLRIQLTALIGQFATKECPATAAKNMRALHTEVLKLEPKLSQQDFWELNQKRHKVVSVIIENQELRALHHLYYFKVAPFWFRLFLNSPKQEFAYLIREVEETAFWMEQGSMLAVANMQQNHIAMAANRLKGFVGLNLLETGRANL
jgi:DNA-binding GntR family transcriptional regulator